MAKLMDVRLTDGRIANRRSKGVDLSRAVELKWKAEEAWPGCGATIVEDGDLYRVYYYREDVSGTPRRDAAPGQEWEVRICGAVQVVRVDWVGTKFRSGAQVQRTKFEGVNVRTGRAIAGDLARLRRRVK